MVGKRNRLINRRQFLKTTAATVAAFGLGTGTSAAEFESEMEVLEEDVDLTAMVFTHFDLEYSVFWDDNYAFNKMVEVPGANTNLYVDEDEEIGVTVTGMGHALCGPSVASILASPQLQLDDTYFVSAGISGTPPDVGTLGSVFIGDYVVAWDYAHRWAQEDSANASYNKKKGKGHGQEDNYALIAEPFGGFTYSYELNSDLIKRAYNLTEGMDLVVSSDTSRMEDYRSSYPFEAARSDPSVGIGTTVSSEEYWHGETFSDQAQYISDSAGAGTYATTEMEDFATASALERYGYLDRYLSIRSVSNFDQPYPGQTVRESLDANSGGFLPSLESVYRVGSTLVDDMVKNPSDWE
jgi:purine nucleoside permease